MLYISCFFDYSYDKEWDLSGEYLETGEDEQGGYVMYQVTTESGNVRYIRVNVVFHRYLTKVGPDYKIKGILVGCYEKEWSEAGVRWKITEKGNLISQVPYDTIYLERCSG